MSDGLQLLDEQSVYRISELAFLLYTEGRWEQALVLFEGLHALYPETPYYCDALSALNLSLNRPEAALRFARSVLALQPDHVGALVRRCEACVRLGLWHDVEQSLQQLDELGRSEEVRRVEARLAAAPQSQTRLLESV